MDSSEIEIWGMLEVGNTPIWDFEFDTPSMPGVVMTIYQDDTPAPPELHTQDGIYLVTDAGLNDLCLPCKDTDSVEDGKEHLLLLETHRQEIMAALSYFGDFLRRNTAN